MPRMHIQCIWLVAMNRLTITVRVSGAAVVVGSQRFERCLHIYIWCFFFFEVEKKIENNLSHHGWAMRIFPIAVLNLQRQGFNAQMLLFCVYVWSYLFRCCIDDSVNNHSEHTSHSCATSQVHYAEHRLLFISFNKNDFTLKTRLKKHSTMACILKTSGWVHQLDRPALKFVYN